MYFNLSKFNHKQSYCNNLNCLYRNYKCLFVDVLTLFLSTGRWRRNTFKSEVRNNKGIWISNKNQTSMIKESVHYIPIELILICDNNLSCIYADY